VQFELTEFLFKKTEMAETRVDELMQLWAASQVQDNRSPPFLNHDVLQEQIDNISLSHVNWNSFSITYTGPLPLQNTPKWMTTEYEVWYRNPREVIHNILSNPDFESEFDYKPFQEFKDGKREWSDFMSGNWAWKQAVSASYFNIYHCMLIHV